MFKTPSILESCHLNFNIYRDIALTGIEPNTLRERARQSSDDTVISQLEKMSFNFKSKNKNPETYCFHFISSDGLYICIGEENRVENEALRKELLLANGQLSNLTRELMKKQAELKKLNELKNQFLGMAAHDLRNPISIILSYTLFLMEDPEVKLPQEKIYLLEKMKNSSEFMLSLLDDLLDVTKIEAGKINLELSDIEINLFLKKIVELNNDLSKSKQIKIFLNMPEKNVKVKIDPNKMTQVMNNFIGNAIKFSPANTQVSISVVTSDDSLIVAVKDQGQGIPREELSKLFLPFQTTSVRSTAGEKSTGLGLSIVHKYILAHHGRIWVESEVGKGTTFFFSIPINFEKSVENSNSSKAHKEVSGHPQDEIAGMKGTFLLIDDSEENHLIIRKFAQGSSLEFEGVFNGADGLKKIEDKHYNFILCDIEMPQMSGFDFVKSVRLSEREQATKKRLPILALSGHSGDEFEKKAKDAGFDGVFTKPLIKKVFLDKVKSFLTSEKTIAA